MQSTTHVTKYTPAVLRGICKKEGITVDEYRIGTLKRVVCEIDNLRRDAITPLDPHDDRALEDLRQQVRIAIADE